MQASMLIAAVCLGVGARPSTTALLNPALGAAKALEGRDCFIQFIVPHCLGHCSSRYSLLIGAHLIKIRST